MIAQVPEGVGYIRSLDRMLVINEEQQKGDDRVFVSYPRYTVEDFIRKGKEFTGKGENYEVRTWMAKP